MLDYLRILLDARLAKMDERGASAVEYGLLITGIAALIIVVVFAFGGVIQDIFQKTCTASAPAPAPVAADDRPAPVGRRWPRTHGGFAAIVVSAPRRSARGGAQPPAELLGDRDPLQGRGVRAEPELATTRAARSLSACSGELLLHRDEGGGVAGRLQRVDVGPGLDEPARARCSPGSTAAVPSATRASTSGTTVGVAQRVGVAGATSGRTRARAGRSPACVPRAASSDPVRTSSWRAWPSSWATIERIWSRGRSWTHVVVEHHPAGAAVARDVGVERRRTT